MCCGFGPLAYVSPVRPGTPCSPAAIARFWSRRRALTCSKSASTGLAGGYLIRVPFVIKNKKPNTSGPRTLEERVEAANAKLNGGTE